MSFEGLVRDVPDYPQPGILFKDITPLLADPDGFAEVVARLADPWSDAGVTKVVGMEARGFLLAAPVAVRLGAGVVPVRKPGKLPRDVHERAYALEYGEASLAVHTDALTAEDRVLVVDDVLATGGTAAATVELVELCGATVVGLAFLLALDFLPGAQRLAGREVLSLIHVEA